MSEYNKLNLHEEEEEKKTLPPVCDTMRTTLLAASFLRASSLLLVVQAFVPQQHHQVPGRTSLSFAPQILYSPVKSVGLCMSSSSNEVENEKASDVAELSNDANGLSSHAHAADVNGATLGDIETSSSSTQMNGDTTNGVVTNGDATSVAKDEEPSSEPYQPRTVNVNLDLDIDNEVFEGISQKLREEVVVSIFVMQSSTCLSWKLLRMFFL